jgi:hypothetical protein
MPPAASPYEATLGNLTGSTVFQSARPKYVRERTQRRQEKELCTRVLELFFGAPSPKATPAGVAAFAREAYERCALRAALSRRVWYRSVGYVAAVRIRAGGQTFGPVLRRAGLRLPPAAG